MKPRSHTHARRGDGLPKSWVVAEKLIPVDGFGVRVHQLLDRRLIAFCRPGLELVATGSETSAPHQVRHQGDILASHCSTSSLNRFDAPRIFLRVFRNSLLPSILLEGRSPAIVVPVEAWCQYPRPIFRIILYSLIFFA